VPVIRTERRNSFQQRYALGEIVRDDGANLILDLQITRDFDGRQRLGELGAKVLFRLTSAWSMALTSSMTFFASSSVSEFLRASSA
jgi:hypothetical protein